MGHGPDTTGWTRYDFRFAPAYRVAALPFGVTPATTRVELGPGGLLVRFGPWRLVTTLENIESASRSGGFSFVKSAGPAHLSLVDRGVTFATNGADAVCVRFCEPVVGIDPTRLIRHPGATLTVRDPSRLIAELDDLMARHPGR